MKLSLPLISCVGVVCVALTACGGGSSDKKNTSSSGKVAQTDSSSLTSVTVSSSDASSSQPVATVVLSGRVAVGAALANATVIARCADGSGFTLPVVTDINGGFQGTVADTANLPCALQATGGEPEVVLHSYVNAPGTVNITLLTDLILASASRLSPADWFDSDDWQSVATNLANSQSELANQLSQTGYNLDADNFSPFTVGFVIGDAHDRIMDQLQEAISADSSVTGYEDLIAKIHSDEGWAAIPPVASQSSSSVGLSSSTPSSVPNSSVGSSLSSAAVSSTTSSNLVVPTSSVPTSSVPTSSVPASSVPTSSIPTSSVPASSVAPSSLPASSVAPSSAPASSVDSSSSTTSSIASSSAPAWNLVWEDNFDGASIDTNKWEHEVNCWGGGNNEAQCYVNNPANSFVDNGFLNIRAIKGNVCGPATNQEDPAYNPADTSVCKDYSSARLRTKGKGDWKYGRMEIRAKMPEGVGIWPAIWMLPTSTSIYGGWPLSGEIDIFEAFQPGVSGPAPTGAANEIHGTLHYGFSWPWNQYSGAGHVPPTNIWDDFYTYVVEWEEGEIRWYVNDVLFARNSNNWFIYYWGGQEVGYKVGTGSQPFDQPFHMILNLALGNGSYVPLPTFNGEKTMEVDYVRVYQCSADPVTGKGCETLTADATVVAQNIAGHVPPADTREEVWLYRGSNGGVQTLVFDVEGAQVDNTLQHALWNDSGALASNTAAAPIDNGSGGTVVWDLNFNNAGAAVAWLASADMTGVEGVQNGFNFGSDPLHNRARQLGEYKFDIWVEAAAPGAKLVAKLGSGFPDISIDEIELTPDMVGKWTPISIRLANLRQAAGSWSQVDWASVMRPFEVEILGAAAHVQLDNLRISCLDYCDIKPKLAPVVITEDMDIFVGELDADWSSPGFGVWQADGQVINIDATVNDPDKGTVTEVVFTPVGMGTFYIQGSAKDLSAFATGSLVFDLKVVSNSGNTSGFLVKADCGHPCVGAEVPVALPDDSDWHTITVPIADINKGGFDITKVNTPFSLWPVFGQQNVTFRVANVRWELAP